MPMNSVGEGDNGVLLSIQCSSVTPKTAVLRALHCALRAAVTTFSCSTLVTGITAVPGTESFGLGPFVLCTAWLLQDDVGFKQALSKT